MKFPVGKTRMRLDGFPSFAEFCCLIAELKISVFFKQMQVVTQFADFADFAERSLTLVPEGRARRGIDYTASDISELLTGNGDSVSGVLHRPFPPTARR
jgi:hypothetical protein